MNSDFDVIGVGACSVDYIGLVNGYPKPDTKNKILQMHVEGGGPVATALVALSRLGCKTSYLGKLGTTPLAQAALQGFNDEHVDVSRVTGNDEDAGAAFAFILADQSLGQRTIWYSDEHVSRLAPEDLSRRFICSARCLILDQYEMSAAIQAAKWAKEAGVLVELDCEDPDASRVVELIQHTDVLIVPEYFALQVSDTTEAESAAEYLQKVGPKIVSVTQGKGGSVTIGDEGYFHQPIFEVETIDTTGCGDVFHGAFVYGLLQEWPLPSVAEFATAVSSLKSCKLGGRSGIPTFPEVASFLAARGSPSIKELLKT